MYVVSSIQPQSACWWCVFALHDDSVCARARVMNLVFKYRPANAYSITWLLILALCHMSLSLLPSAGVETHQIVVDFFAYYRRRYGLRFQ